MQRLLCHGPLSGRTWASCRWPWGAVEQPHHSQVRGTGGKGFLSGWSRVDSQDSSWDEPVCGHNERQKDQEHQGAAAITEKLKNCGVCRGKAHQQRYLMEEMVNLPWVAIGEAQSGTGLHQSINPSHKPRACYQMGTQLQAHENMVAQWVAYGHIAVIGHGHQEEHSSSPRGRNRKIWKPQPAGEIDLEFIR